MIKTFASSAELRAWAERTPVEGDTPINILTDSELEQLAREIFAAGLDSRGSATTGFADYWQAKKKEIKKETEVSDTRKLSLKQYASYKIEDFKKLNKEDSHE